jgi:rhamnogalacturonyl hydrolase YesR
MGYMGWGYLKLFDIFGADEHGRHAKYCFDWLTANRSPGFEDHCWGNAFPFATRAGTIPARTPTIVWSSLIGLAFMDAFEELGCQKYLEVAASTAEWIKSLPRELTRSGTCLSYVPGRQLSIHNSNMLGAALLARVAARTNDHDAIALAREAVTYTCARQHDDGAWPYGEAPEYQWVDNFHSGYNLDSLKRYIDCTGDQQFVSNLRTGLEYFKRHFTEPDGRPKYYHDRSLPTDIQCAAQAIDTLTFHSVGDPECLELAATIARWTIDNMQARDGHFYYRDLGWTKVKTPMFHWGQATMFKALTHLLVRINTQATI